MQHVVCKCARGGVGAIGGTPVNFLFFFIKVGIRS